VFFNLLYVQRFVITKGKRSMRIKKKKKTKSEWIACRVSKEEQNDIKIKANLYTEGNVSEWLIHAARNYAPKREELE